MTNVEALKNLYIAEGGDASDVADLDTSAEVINTIAGFKAIKDITVQPDKAGTTYPWTDKTPADMQTKLVVADGAITGTLKYIEGGLSPSGALSGSGNFMALRFVDTNHADKVEVGLVPSAGTGFVELDVDMNAVFKVSGILDGKQQVLKVKTTVGTIEKVQTFDLTGLVLNQS